MPKKCKLPIYIKSSKNEIKKPMSNSNQMFNKIPESKHQVKIPESKHQVKIPESKHQVEIPSPNQETNQPQI